MENFVDFVIGDVIVIFVAECFEVFVVNVLEFFVSSIVVVGGVINVL